LIKEERTEVTEIDLPIDKACFIILKAREFDAKVEASEPESASNAIDDEMASVLEEHSDDPVVEELTSLINDLSEDEQIDLVALTWLGRDDYTREDWSSVRQEAASAHNNDTARYLLGTPLFADYLADGLSILGHECSQYVMDRL
jgi:hypothetical protein